MGITESQGITWKGTTTASELSSVLESVHHWDVHTREETEKIEKTVLIATFVPSSGYSGRSLPTATQ